VFPVILLMFLLSAVSAWATLWSGVYSPTAPLLAMLVSGLAMAVVFLQKLTHPDAFFDWIQGGVTGILQDDSRALKWQDWEILLSRHGEIDLKTRTLKIEKRAFFNLIPFATVERSLDEFYAVSMRIDPATPERRLELRANDTRHVLIVDVGHSGFSGEAKAMLGRLHVKLRDLVETHSRTRQRRDAAAGAGLADRLLRAHEGSQDAPPPPRWLHPCQLEHRSRADRRSHLLQLQTELDAARFVRSSRSRGWIDGRHDGRKLTISTWISDDDEPEEDLTWYTLAIDSQAVLRVTRPPQRLEVTPAERSPYEVVSALRSGRLFESGQLEPLLHELFDELGCRDLTIEKGTIYAEKPAHALDLCPNELHRFFGALTRVAKLVEGLTASLVTSITAYEQTRCPFCRDDLRPSEELVDCASCGTRHHAECFEDLGECTIRGCDSQRAEPVARRADGPPSGRVRG
jgi:hypothetical protein